MLPHTNRLLRPAGRRPRGRRQSWVQLARRRALDPRLSPPAPRCDGGTSRALDGGRRRTGPPRTARPLRQFLRGALVGRCLLVAAPCVFLGLEGVLQLCGGDTEAGSVVALAARRASSASPPSTAPPSSARHLTTPTASRRGTSTTSIDEALGAAPLFGELQVSVPVSGTCSGTSFEEVCSGTSFDERACSPSCRRTFSRIAAALPLPSDRPDRPYPRSTPAPGPGAPSRRYVPGLPPPPSPNHPPPPTNPVQ